MGLLLVKDLELQYNTKTIFSRLNFEIPENKVIGLVGINGSGKSSLMKIIAGEIEFDLGEIVEANKVSKTYLAQQINYPEISVAEYLSHHFADSKSLEIYQERLADLAKFFQMPDAAKLVTKLSGGQQRQLSLLKTFALNSDLILLDEPTNHLDVTALLNLQELVKNYSKTIFLISHDRYFLDKTVDEIWELEKGKLYKHTGNYSEYVENKTRRRRQHEIRYSKLSKELEREKEWVNAGVKARATKDQGRLNRYYELKDWVENNKPYWKKPYLPVPKPSQHGNKILILKDLAVKIPQQNKFICKDCNYEFLPETRLGILGPNGSGKTTFLQTILNLLPHAEGKIIVGLNTEFNYQDQKRLQLDDGKTIHEIISDGGVEMKFGGTKTNVYAYMKKFLFFSEDLKKSVSNLSGGQKARLLLAKILKQGGNFLILDEPTNDLDLETMEALENTLNKFPGPVILVSHDRYFLDKICTEILALEGDGQYTLSTGGYSAYIEKYSSESEFWSSPGKPKTLVKLENLPSQEVEKSKNKLNDNRYKPKDIRRFKSKMRDLEKQILDVETEIKDKQIKMSFNSFYTQKAEKVELFMQDLKDLEAKKSSLEDAWLALSEKVS